MLSVRSRVRESERVVREERERHGEEGEGKVSPCVRVWSNQNNPTSIPNHTNLQLNFLQKFRDDN